MLLSSDMSRLINTSRGQYALNRLVYANTALSTAISRSRVVTWTETPFPANLAQPRNVMRFPTTWLSSRKMGKLAAGIASFVGIRILLKVVFQATLKLKAS